MSPLASFALAAAAWALAACIDDARLEVLR